MITLRDYQEEAVQSVYEYFETNSGNPIVVVPTAGGKSIIISEIIKRALHYYSGQRFLMLTHVKELVEQNYKAMLKFIDKDRAGIYSAGLGKRDTDEDVICASIQSVYKKAKEIGHIDLIIVDECHLISGKECSMYSRIIKELKEINDLVKVVGFSATPYRTGEGLLTDMDGALFTDICYEVTIEKLLKDGYITELVSKWGVNQVDLTGVKTVAGEFNNKQMGERFNDDVSREAISESLRLADGRKCIIVFCSNVEHALKVTNIINDLGETATCVVGNTPKSERDKNIKDFKAGKYRFLVNCGVLTTGYDEPRIDCIILLRATKSPGLYIQMLGRGMRLHPDKHNCVVLDYGRNIERFGPVDKIKISRKSKRKDGLVMQPMKACENANCRASNYIQARECYECGTPFTFNQSVKHERNASGGAIISGQHVPPELYDVSNVSYSLHKKRKTGSRTLRVRYIISMMKVVDEYICIEHKGYARKKAISWYREVSGNSECPLTIEGVLNECMSFKKPKKILVKKEGKYERVIKREY